MTKAEQVFEKVSKVTKDKKAISTKGMILPSLSGAVLGGVGAVHAMRHSLKGMPGLSLATMLAGGITGSRLGVLFQNKMEQAVLDRQKAEKK